jgi:hypothetical protein
MLAWAAAHQGLAEFIGTGIWVMVFVIMAVFAVLAIYEPEPSDEQLARRAAKHEAAAQRWLLETRLDLQLIPGADGLLASNGCGRA